MLLTPAAAPVIAAAAAAGDVRDGAGDGLLVLNGVDPNSSSMRVASITGHGLNCSNVTLISSPAAAQVPGGYFWPGGDVNSVVVAKQGKLTGSALAAAIAVPLVVLIVASAAAAALLLVRKRRRRQRKQRQQQLDLEKGQVYDDQLLPAGPGSRCSRCSRCSRSSSLQQELPQGLEVCSSSSEQPYLPASHCRSSSRAGSSDMLSGSKDAAACSVCSAAEAAVGPAAADAGVGKGVNAQRRNRQRRVWEVGVRDSASAAATDQQPQRHSSAPGAASSIELAPPGMLGSNNSKSDVLHLQQQQQQSGMLAGSSSSEAAEQQQQLQQHGLQLLRAWPVGTLGLQGLASNASRSGLGQSWLGAAAQAGAEISQAWPAGIQAAGPDSSTHASQAWGDYSGGHSRSAEMQDGLSYSSSAAAGCSQFLPVHDWRSAQEAAAAMGCVVQLLPGEGGQLAEMEQQQQQHAPGAYGTQTLFHSACIESQQALAQQQQQHTAAAEQASGIQEAEQQQQQHDAANAAAALASRAVMSPAGVTSPTSPRSKAGAGSAAPAASKPWQRVSCAIRWVLQLPCMLAFFLPRLTNNHSVNLVLFSSTPVKCL
jgi:hypothetical protein